MDEPVGSACHQGGSGDGHDPLPHDPCRHQRKAEKRWTAPTPRSSQVGAESGPPSGDGDASGIRNYGRRAVLGTTIPPSIFGIPKCPPRWERSSGLMEPETATRLTSVALATRIATLLIALFSKRIQTSVTPWFPFLLTNCF